MIYHDGVRRSLWVCLGALVFCVSAGAASVMADEPSSTETTIAPTTSTPSTAPTTTGPTTSTSVAHATTTTKPNTATTSTTKPISTAPVPPPASGAQQPLVQDLLGTSVVATTTTVAPPPTTATSTTTQLATPISTHKDAPRPATLVLATVAWLASLGGLLVYAEDKRSTQWKHLAR